MFRQVGGRRVAVESTGSKNRWHHFRGCERDPATTDDGAPSKVIHSFRGPLNSGHFIYDNQGERHAEWPHKYAPTPTGGVICRSLSLRENEYECCPLAI
jgi:hypothetical protein